MRHPFYMVMPVLLGLLMVLQPVPTARAETVYYVDTQLGLAPNAQYIYAFSEENGTVIIISMTVIGGGTWKDTRFSLLNEENYGLYCDSLSYSPEYTYTETGAPNGLLLTMTLNATGRYFLLIENLEAAGESYHFQLILERPDSDTTDDPTNDTPDDEKKDSDATSTQDISGYPLNGLLVIIASAGIGVACFTLRRRRQ